MISSVNKKKFNGRDDKIHSGHRSRMRRKFMDFGDRFFDDYELLEMFLYFSIPVRDTNPIAKRLIAAFGSLDGVLAAPIEELAVVDGIGEKTAKMIRLAGLCRSIPEAGIIKEVLLDTYEVCGNFLAEMLGEREDCVTVLLSLDNKMRLISCDEIYPYDCSSGGVQPKAFADTAIKKRASVVVIAHNHPHGPLYPTEGDIQTNKAISAAFDSVGVIMAEHYVVCSNRYLGFMNHMATAFKQDSAINKFLRSKHGL